MSWRTGAMRIVMTAAVAMFCARGALACPSFASLSFASVPNKSEEAFALQRLLLSLYGKPEDVARLSDGILGRTTKENALRFCAEFTLAPGSETEGGQSAQLIDAMTLFDRITKPRPDWRTTVSSGAFEDWLESVGPRTAGDLVQGIDLGSTPIARAFLLPDFEQREQAPAREVAVDGLFVIDDAALALLKALGSLQDLEGTQAEGQVALRDAIAASLGVDLAVAARFIDPLVSAAEVKTLFRLDAQAGALFEASGLASVAPETLASLSEFPLASKEALADFVIGAFRRIELDSKAAGDGDVLSDAGVARLRRTVLANAVPLTVYTLTEKSLEALPIDAEGTSVPEDLADKLAALSGVRFGNEHLFRTALRVQAGLDDGALVAIIEGLARQSTGPVSSYDLGLTPLRWEGGDCGCGVFESLDASYPSHLYGLFGYWQAPFVPFVDGQHDPAFEPPDPAKIDFSLLERVGYYGVTFNSRGEIRNALHFHQESTPARRWWWQNSDPYSDFVKRAHKYKTRVDLVVHNARWTPWLAIEQRDDAFASQFSAPLRDSVQREITRPLAGYRNALKPVISFGNSPRRTRGDGVTFDFDFSGVSEADQVWMFDRLSGQDGFFGRLARDLAPAPRSKGQVDYAINLVVPMRCLIDADQPFEDSKARAAWIEQTGCAFFAIDRLAQLQHVDLLLIDGTRGGNDIAAMQRLRDAVDRLRVEDQVGFLRKLVPLVSVGRAQRLDEKQMRYVDWNYAGLSTWGINDDAATADRLRGAFTQAGRHLQVDGNVSGVWSQFVQRMNRIETAVCNKTCPHRWLLRSIIFFIVVAALVCVVASYWFLRLREVYDSKPFVVLVVLAVVTLILTLWCDPYWSRQKSVILFLSLLAALIGWSIARQRRLRAQYYP